MDEFKQLRECYVVKSTLSIGIIEVLDFWPLLVLVLTLGPSGFRSIGIGIDFWPVKGIGIGLAKLVLSVSG